MDKKRRKELLEAASEAISQTILLEKETAEIEKRADEALAGPSDVSQEEESEIIEEATRLKKKAIEANERLQKLEENLTKLP
jgi:hypothetical protein